MVATIRGRPRAVQAASRPFESRSSAAFGVAHGFDQLVERDRTPARLTRAGTSKQLEAIAHAATHVFAQDRHCRRAVDQVNVEEQSALARRLFAEGAGIDNKR